MKKIFLLIVTCLSLLTLHAQTSSLYVLTPFGGVNDYGSISAYNTKSHTITTIYSFIASDGIYPVGSLIKGTDEKLYGMTGEGANYTDSAAIFSFDIIRAGFLPQSLKKLLKLAHKIFSSIGIPKKENQTTTLTYEQIVMPIVNIIEEQQTIINKQDKLIKELLKRVTSLEQKK